MLISTVICTYNRVGILKTCLEFITQQKAAPTQFEVLIIDNNSSDGTKGFVENFIQQYTGDLKFYYFLETKKGLSAARNRGLLESKGDYINFIDDDALTPRHYLQTLSESIHKYPKAAGFGGKIIPKYFTAEPEWMSVYSWGLVSKHDLGDKIIYYTKTGQYPTGCNMTYKKEVLELVGGFDERLVRRCDDKYIAYAVKKAGFDIIYLPDVYLDHYIDENRLSNRLPEICKDTGHHEKIRLRKLPVIYTYLKFAEYIFKFAASLILFIFFSLSGSLKKGIFVVKMRLWFLEGFLRKKNL